MTEPTSTSSPQTTAVMVVAWLWVLLPFLYGVWQLLIKVVPLFSG